MRLILFRHGIAEDMRADMDDASRRLTPEGIEKTRQAARGLAALAGPIDAVLTSPKLRAMETAQLLCEAVGMSAQVCGVLSRGTVKAVLADVAARKEQALVLVGHEPTLSSLANAVCGFKEGSGLELKKAGAIILQMEPASGFGVLEAALPPGLLRTAGSLVK